MSEKAESSSSGRLKKQYSKGSLTTAEELSTDPNRAKLKITVKVRGPCPVIDSKVKLQSYILIRVPKPPKSGRGPTTYDVIDCPSFDQIYRWDPKFYRLICRYREGDHGVFKGDDAAALHFLLNWMADNYPPDEEGCTKVDIKVFMQAAMIAERFRCTRFWQTHRSALVKCAREAAEQLRFITPPEMTLKIERYTVEDSPIQRAAIDVLVWRRDVNEYSDFDIWCNRILQREYEKEKDSTKEERDWVKKNASTKFQSLIMDQIRAKSAMGDAADPFKWMIEAQALDWYSYPTDFESKPFRDPIVSLAEAQMITHQEILETFENESNTS